VVVLWIRIVSGLFNEKMDFFQLLAVLGVRPQERGTTVIPTLAIGSKVCSTAGAMAEEFENPTITTRFRAFSVRIRIEPPEEVLALSNPTPRALRVHTCILRWQALEEHMQACGQQRLIAVSLGLRAEIQEVASRLASEVRIDVRE
jgi:hypothetical protein